MSSEEENIFSTDFSFNQSFGSEFIRIYDNYGFTLEWKSEESKILSNLDYEIKVSSKSSKFNGSGNKNENKEVYIKKIICRYLHRSGGIEMSEIKYDQQLKIFPQTSKISLDIFWTFFKPNNKISSDDPRETSINEILTFENFISNLENNRDPQFADVIFQTFDSIGSVEKIYANRCILYGHSPIFDALFEEENHETPIQIEIESDFSAQIVTRVIQFCYGQNANIKGFEKDLIKFAEKYSIEKLKIECVKSLELTPLNLVNICEITQIAVEENHEILKQKCIHFLKQQNQSKKEKFIKTLPLEILEKI